MISAIFPGKGEPNFSSINLESSVLISFGFGEELREVLRIRV